MNTGTRIRTASPDEYARIGELMVHAYSTLEGFLKPSDHPGYFAMLKNIGAITEKPGTEIFVAASDEDKIIGAVVYFSDMTQYGSGGTATTEKNCSGFRFLAVADAARGQGVGKLLTRACIEKAEKTGSSQVIIHTTEAMLPAWKMYEQIGFKRSPDLDFIQGDLKVYGFRYLL